MAKRSPQQIGRRSRAKGKVFQKAIARVIARRLGLDEGDVRTCLGGVTEADVQMSAEARRRYPFHTECKNYGRWQASHMRAWLEQAAGEAPAGMTPTVVFKFNRDAEPYVALRLSDFLDWVL